MELIKLFGDETIPQATLLHRWNWFTIDEDYTYSCDHCGHEFMEGDEALDEEGNIFCERDCLRAYFNDEED